MKVLTAHIASGVLQVAIRIVARTLRVLDSWQERVERWAGIREDWPWDEAA